MGGSTVSSKKEEVVVGWAGLHCSFAQMVNVRELILLDRDSTDTVFCNPKYVTNIGDLNNPLSKRPFVAFEIQDPLEDCKMKYRYERDLVRSSRNVLCIIEARGEGK
jgi:hypothetical protein